MPRVAYSLTVCNLKLAKGRSYKAQILPKGRGLLIRDGAPGARSAGFLLVILGGVVLAGLFALSYSGGLASGPPLNQTALIIALYLCAAVPTTIAFWRMPAEARKVLLDCRRRRAEFRVDEGVVDGALLGKTQEIEIHCTNDLFRVEPVDVGLGMYAVVINLNGYPFAVAASRSAEEMIKHVDVLRSELHRSMTG